MVPRLLFLIRARRTHALKCNPARVVSNVREARRRAGDDRRRSDCLRAGSAIRGPLRLVYARVALGRSPSSMTWCNPWLWALNSRHSTVHSSGGGGEYPAMATRTLAQAGDKFAHEPARVSAVSQGDRLPRPSFRLPHSARAAAPTPGAARLPTPKQATPPSEDRSGWGAKPRLARRASAQAR